MGPPTAATGWLDWWLVTSPGTRARRIGLLHGLVNAGVLVLFAVSWLLRLGEPGWTPTWPAPPKQRRALPLTIDHILVDRRVRVEKVTVVRIPRSDHRAVIAVLRLPSA